MEGSEQQGQTLADVIAAEVEKQVAAQRAAEHQGQTDPLERDTEANIPKVPRVDKIPETYEEAQALATMLAAFRKEVADLKDELRRRTGRPVQTTGPVETMEERTAKRLALINEHEYYCPGCGNLGHYPQACRGREEAPHAKIEMVSTEELGGDPNLHTKAPPTDPDELARLAA